MRLFVGIPIPRDSQQTLERLVSTLRPLAHLKWSPPYNLHITTKFIGEWPEQRLDELIRSLHAMPPQDVIPIEIRGLGWFPNPHRPRVFWAGIHGGSGLADLARHTDEATAALGVERETRPFSPHLTLARVREAVPLQNLQHAIAQLPTDQFGQFTANCFALYRSDPGPAGSIYTQLADIRLVQR